MRTIPTDIQAHFSSQYGMEPVFLLYIDFDGDEKYYSTVEWDMDGTPVYGVVDVFEGFESISTIESLSQASKVSVTFIDQTGFFKDKFDNIKLYSEDVVCKLYLSYRGATEKMLLFVGDIDDNSIYNIDEKTLSIDIFYKLPDDPICYVPNIDDIPEEDSDYEVYKALLTGVAWPEVFGTVLNMSPARLIRAGELTVSEILNYISGSSPYAMQVKGEIIPALNTDDFYTCELVGSSGTEFVLRVVGKFTSLNTNAKTGVFQFYNTGWGGEDYELSQYWALNEEISNVTVNIGEYMVITVPDDVFIKHTYIQITLIGGSFSILKGICTEQEGNRCTLNIVQESYIGVPVTLQWAAKSFGNIYTVGVGSRLVLRDLATLSNTFIVDSKIGTTVSKVKILRETGFIDLPTSFWTAYNAAENAFWTGSPACRYIILTGDYHLYNESEEGINNDIKGDSGFYVDVSNTLDTDIEAVTHLMELYAGYGTDSGTIAAKDTDFAITQEEDIEQVVPEILWQRRRAARLTITESDEYELELINLDTTPDTVYDFDISKIDKNDPILFTYQPLEELKTRILANVQQNDHHINLKAVRKSNNVDVYSLKILEVDYYAFEDVDTAEADIEWWVERLSKPFGIIEFTGYIDAIGLEIWDRVTVDIGSITFKDITDNTPLTNILPTGTSINTFIGRIIYIDAKPVQGTIRFRIKLERAMGGET